MCVGSCWSYRGPEVSSLLARRECRPFAAQPFRRRALPLAPWTWVLAQRTMARTCARHVVSRSVFAFCMLVYMVYRSARSCRCWRRSSRRGRQLPKYRISSHVFSLVVLVSWRRGLGDSRAAAAASRVAEVSPPRVRNLSDRWAYLFYLFINQSNVQKYTNLKLHM